jgi:hypothetical protein
MARFLTLLCLVFFLFCCGGGGCPSIPGGPCDPVQDEACAYDYYCSSIGVCTQHCTVQEDCDRGRRCGPDNNICVNGQPCINGACGGPIECIEGYCQAPCAYDASCNYDPYAPWMREGDEG